MLDFFSYFLFSLIFLQILYISTCYRLVIPLEKQSKTLNIFLAPQLPHFHGGKLVKMSWDFSWNLQKQSEMKFHGNLLECNPMSDIGTHSRNVWKISRLCALQFKFSEQTVRNFNSMFTFSYLLQWTESRTYFKDKLAHSAFVHKG